MENNMIDETNFCVTVNRRDYLVEIDDGCHSRYKGRLTIIDSALGLVVTDKYGECNPLLGFWDSADSLLTGAARTSKIQTIIKDAVTSSLDDLAEYRAQLIECDGDVPKGVSAILSAAGL